MIPRANRRPSLFDVLVLWVVIALLPACSAAAGGHRSRESCPPGSDPAGNLVYRPAYPALRTRPLYLSNYAGVQYPPLRRRAPLEPTAVRRPFSGWLAAQGSHP